MAVMAEPRRFAASAVARPVAPPREVVAEAPTRPRIVVEHLTARFGTVAAVKDVSLTMLDRRVTAIIGTSGCGKSTFLRCLNRMHETISLATVEGSVRLDGRDIYHSSANATEVRKVVGMVFQKPTPFPTMSIRDNVAAGLKVKRDDRSATSDIDAVVERALRRAGLWDEVKDRLATSAIGLSGGQQQRLCIARALATEPEVLLLDEPTASLDPIGTTKVEELVYELRKDVTIAIVTHNMQQAARVSDYTAFFLHGEMVEVAPTTQLFMTPKDPKTEAYITGRFG
jgi:phosphate transport system ATP-binding protein